jgi:SRSO17 transposase
MDMDVATVSKWEDRFEQMADQVGPCFGRRDLRRQAVGYVQGLLGRVQRKNGWQVSEYLGREKPYGVQRLLGRASWDADDVRDVLVGYARQHLLKQPERGGGEACGGGGEACGGGGEACGGGGEACGGVLIVDETGFLKKGTKSAGVQRQYSGTAGRIENCQVGVFLALASSRGRALIDRELYVPESWCADRSRCDEAGVPAEVMFATKPKLAMRMLCRAFEAGLEAEYVLADEVYGSDGKFRRFLENRSQPYVVAVTAQQRLWVHLEQKRVDEIAQTIPHKAWSRLSVADGAKGPRVFDWAATKFGVPTEHGLIRWLLIRRSLEVPTELAYYLCLAPPQAAARDLAIAAGKRWSIESCFEAAKQETGLDEYEVRSFDGWYRHVTLSMLALAFLAAVRAAAAEADKRPRSGGAGRKKVR